MNNLFGFKIKKEQLLHNVLVEIFTNIGNANWVTTLLGITFTAVMYGIKKLSVKVPRLFFLVNEPDPLKLNEIFGSRTSFRHVLVAQLLHQ